MNWQVVVRPEAGSDVIEAAQWYDSQRAGLGDQFVSEIFGVFDALALNPPPLSPPSHQKYPLALPERFPYRVIYEVIDEAELVVIAAVLHAARHDRTWQRRI